MTKMTKNRQNFQILHKTSRAPATLKFTRINNINSNFGNFKELNGDLPVGWKRLHRSIQFHLEFCRKLNQLINSPAISLIQKYIKRIEQDNSNNNNKMELIEVKFCFSISS